MFSIGLVVLQLCLYWLLPETTYPIAEPGLVAYADKYMVILQFYFFQDIQQLLFVFPKYKKQLGKKTIRYCKLPKQLFDETLSTAFGFDDLLIQEL